MWKGAADCVPFGPGLSAPLACSTLTGFIAGSPRLVIPPSLAPLPPWCWQDRRHLAVSFWTERSGYVVSTASNSAVAGRAGVDRLLRTEPQVWSELSSQATQSNKRLHVAPTYTHQNCLR